MKAAGGIGPWRRPADAGRRFPGDRGTVAAARHCLQCVDRQACDHPIFTVFPLRLCYRRRLGRDCPPCYR